MPEFSTQSFPAVGLGLEFHLPYLSTDVADASRDIPREIVNGYPALFDYVQIQPSHVLFIPKLLSVFANTPLLLHSSHLSLGSIGMDMDEEYLSLTRRLVQETRTPWLTEHISWTRFPGGDTQHFVLPFLSAEVADTIVSNAITLQRVSGVPLLLENAPRTFAVPLKGQPTEGAFIRDIAERSGAGFLLDLDSAVITAEALGYDLTEYIESLPLDRLIEVHIGDPVAHWELLSTLLKLPSVKAVTVEYDVVGQADYETTARLSELRALLRPVSGATSHSPSYERAVSSAELSEGEPLFQLSETASLSREGDKCRVTANAHGSVFELPAAASIPIAHFVTPRPLGSLFIQPDCWNGIPGSQLFLILRSLIEAKILVPAVCNGDACSHERTPWDNWGSARSFYLETRSTGETHYLTNSEVENQLSLQMDRGRQPSAYKDYWVHPFFALPNPTQGDRNSLEFLDVVLERRTARSFGPDSLSADMLSKLLFYTWGAQSAEGNPRGDVFLKKTSPSGGSLHPVEVYPVLLNVAGFSSGVYHYSVRRHGLELLAREDPMEWVRAACGGQEWVADCAAIFVSTAVLRRPAWKYHFGRAFRVALQDSGHLSGMFNLVASWLGLASFTTGALRDELLEDKLGLIHLEEPVLLVNGVGTRANDVMRPERPRTESV